MFPTRSDTVVLFTRYPVPGKCKTRLIPALGPEGAAALHQEMTLQIIAQLKKLAATHPHQLEIHHDGGTEAQMRSWLGSGHTYRRQAEGDIGRRMQAAINSHLGRRQRLLLIGSDCPDLTAEILEEAFVALTTNDLVLGPAYDGGYYLLGVGPTLMNGISAFRSSFSCKPSFKNNSYLFSSTNGIRGRNEMEKSTGYFLTAPKKNKKMSCKALKNSASICHTLFHDIPWSTDAVYLTTIKRAEQHRLRCHTLARLYDIDTPADLRHLHHHPHPE